MLVDAFPAHGTGASVATDGTLYQIEILTSSHSLFFAPSYSSVASISSPGHGSSSHGSKENDARRWGDHPVLLLLGIQLGLDGCLYTFPQSVGVAGGRPSSSYYFVSA
ncbi:hypothetical protein B0H13DRAFT_2372310 [Mycena leptocephala]|nr:hypothetical protein B0H13DRAFT_2372310 [Mycena leptocephala]